MTDQDQATFLAALRRMERYTAARLDAADADGDIFVPAAYLQNVAMILAELIEHVASGRIAVRTLQ